MLKYTAYWPIWGARRKIIYGDHTQLGITFTSPGDRINAGCTRSAEALWLVCWVWAYQVDAGVRETALQTCVALGLPGDSRGVGWWYLLRTWILDTPGSSRHLRRDVHGDVQKSLEKRLHSE